MPEPPKPENESVRLETLGALNILDTDPEESFDRVARLATIIFDVPIAHVSLIDEHREWFKARYGVNAREGDRRGAFCAHTILSDDPMIVEDTHGDPRFRDNPQVTGETSIRFYAGAPLITRSGVAVGALCVKDHRPRKFSKNDVRILEQLAAVVVDEMEHRLVESTLVRVDAELRLKNTMLTTQQETSLDGILVVDREGTVVTFNQRFARMWDIPDEVLDSRSDDRALHFVLDRLVDPQAFLARVQHLYEHPDESSSDEITLKDGRVFDRYSTAMRSPDGEHHGRVWYFRDITDRLVAERALRESRERVSGILESAMDAIVTVDENRTVTLFNAAAEDVFRCPADEALGRSFNAFASRSFRELLDRCERAFRRKGSRKRYMWAPEGLTALRGDGVEFPVEATISQADVADQRLLTIILRDVNERVQAEHELTKLQQQNVYLQEEFKNELGFEEIIGRSPAMQEVLRAVQQVAATESTVLLTGETGTGKELIARAVHKLSGRSDRMLVKVNCAALPAGLIESELFGHEKGAFTGALARKTGRFELANKGTIFLDEIGDLPLELQSKLLRVLQEGEFERVGGTKVLGVDVRVITATNRDLEREIEQKRFRPDLFYRLNVFPIRLPALRERREDIPLLTRHFTLKHSTNQGKHIDTIPNEAVHALSDYDWPGNIRELQNVIERAVILTRGSKLELEGALPVADAATQRSDVTTLRDVERKHILDALERTGWRVSGPGGAAEILGLKRTTLEARMKKLEIVRGR